MKQVALDTRQRIFSMMRRHCPVEQIHDERQVLSVEVMASRSRKPSDALIFVNPDSWNHMCVLTSGIIHHSKTTVIVQVA